MVDCLPLIPKHRSGFLGIRHRKNFETLRQSGNDFNIIITNFKKHTSFLANIPFILNTLTSSYIYIHLHTHAGACSNTADLFPCANLSLVTVK